MSDGDTEKWRVSRTQAEVCYAGALRNSRSLWRVLWTHNEPSPTDVYVTLSSWHDCGESLGPMVCPTTTIWKRPEEVARATTKWRVPRTQVEVCRGIQILIQDKAGCGESEGPMTAQVPTRVFSHARPARRRKYQMEGSKRGDPWPRGTTSWTPRNTTQHHS